jgi:hypothetical protein
MGFSCINKSIKFFFLSLHNAPCNILGVRILKSKYNVPKNIDKRISKLQLKIDLNNSYVDFLKNIM